MKWLKLSGNSFCQSALDGDPTWAGLPIGHYQQGDPPSWGCTSEPVPSNQEIDFTTYGYAGIYYSFVSPEEFGFDGYEGQWANYDSDYGEDLQEQCQTGYGCSDPNALNYGGPSIFSYDGSCIEVTPYPPVGNIKATLSEDSIGWPGCSVTDIEQYGFCPALDERQQITIRASHYDPIPDTYTLEHNFTVNEGDGFSIEEINYGSPMENIWIDDLGDISLHPNEQFITINIPDFPGTDIPYVCNNPCPALSPTNNSVLGGQCLGPPYNNYGECGCEGDILPSHSCSSGSDGDYLLFCGDVCDCQQPECATGPADTSLACCSPNWDWQGLEESCMVGEMSSGGLTAQEAWETTCCDFICDEACIDCSQGHITDDLNSHKFEIDESIVIEEPPNLTLSNDISIENPDSGINQEYSWSYEIPISSLLESDVNGCTDDTLGYQPDINGQCIDNSSPYLETSYILYELPNLNQLPPEYWPSGGDHLISVVDGVPGLSADIFCQQMGHPSGHESWESDGTIAPDTAYWDEDSGWQIIDIGQRMRMKNLRCIITGAEQINWDTPCIMGNGDKNGYYATNYKPSALDDDGSCVYPNIDVAPLL